MEANDFIISELSLNKPAQMLCPKTRAKTSISASIPHSSRVTIIALLALSGWSAPNSFDTLVLYVVKYNFFLGQNMQI